MSKVMQASKAKIYGSQNRVKEIAKIGGQCRFVWNHFLALNIESYRETGKFIFYKEMSALLTKLLHEEPALAGCPHRPAQMTVQRLDRALKDCAKTRGKTRKGFPKFKRRSANADAFSFVGREIRLADGRIRLPKIGWYRVRGLDIPADAVLKQAHIRQEPDGWHVAVQFEAEAKTYAEPTQPVIGLDAGLTHLAILSDGTKIGAPRLARKSEDRIRRLNRQRDRRAKGSVNRRRTVAKLGRVHRRVADCRRDHMHKATRALVDRYEGFAVETLNIKGLMKTRMGKSFADAGLGEFLRVLRYKSEWAGRQWLTLPAFTRSTGVCPDCGVVGPKLSLSVREWTCAECGAVHDRDVAAARTILAKCQHQVGQALPEPPRLEAKRGFAVDVGVDRIGSIRHYGPPTNVLTARESAPLSKG
jgi:putative transposase